MDCRVTAAPLLFEASRSSSSRSNEEAAGFEPSLPRNRRPLSGGRSARGRSRWSRAILSSRRGFSKHKKKKRAVTGCNRLGKLAYGLFRLRGKRFAGVEVERRRRVLGRLVPGCRKLTLPKLVEEAGDYIAALEMQVRAMSALTKLLAPSLIRSPPYTI